MTVRTERALTIVVPATPHGDASASRRERAAEGREFALLLSRARRISVPTDAHALLFHVFGVESDADADLPIAAVTGAFDLGTTTQAYYLRVDPVMLQADRDTLILLGQRALSLSQDEAGRLVAALNQHFSGEPWRIEAATPLRWYIRMPHAPRLRTTCWSQIVGRSVYDVLPTGDDARAWRAIVNEAQMVLHQHPVNDMRIANGTWVANSVWMWGGGHLPRVPRAKYAQVWSDDAVALGLATLSDTPHAGAPHDAKAWLDAATIPGDHLIVLSETNEELVKQLNADWFAPLTDALRQSRLQRLTICPLNGHAYFIDRAALKRWWVRPRPLHALLESPPA